MYAYNPMLNTIGQAVSKYYPDMAGHTRPKGSDFDAWKFHIVMKDETIIEVIIRSEFSDAIRSVCMLAVDKKAMIVKFVR